MKVKCQICQQYIEKENAYCVSSGKVNKYYCSKEEYDNYIAIKQNENKIWNTIVESYKYFIDYDGEAYGIARSLINDPKIKDIPKETIAEFMVEFKEKIKKTILSVVEKRGEFDTPWNKGRYINGILAKEIIEKKWKATHKKEISTPIKKNVDIEFYGGENERGPNRPNKRPNRRPLAQLEEEYNGD